jgi:diguanylate cyclase (GGDEF)-like protein/PAS domain S-box-containing protein
VSILLFSLVVMTFNLAQKRVRAGQENDIEELVNLAASAVEQMWIKPREHAVTALSQSSTLHRRLDNQATFTELAAEWEEIQRCLKGCYFIYYGLADGSIEHFPPDPLPAGYDPRERPWYRTGISAQKTPAWTTPYAEIITGEMVVSTVIPVLPEQTAAAETGPPIGVISMDITLAEIEKIFAGIALPAGGTMYVTDAQGHPIVTSHVHSEDASLTSVPDTIPANSADTLVKCSEPLSNAWQVCVVVPRTALGQHLVQLRGPVLFGAGALILLAAATAAMLLWRMARRTHLLAEYFRTSMEDLAPLEEIFSGTDEFSYLNRKFNQAVETMRHLNQEKQTRDQASRFLVKRAPIGFFRTDRAGHILYLNPHFIHMLGYRDLSAMKTELPSIAHIYAHAEAREEFIARLAQDGEVHNFKAELITRSGAHMWVSITAHVTAQQSPESSAEDAFVVEGFILDITSDMLERSELVKQAGSDPLTGAANRRTFDAVFERAVQHAVEHKRRISLIEFDLDRFKEINDTHGHAVGDAVLCQVTKIATGMTRKDDLFARLGGDEFAILLPDSDSREAMHLAERLQEALDHSAAEVDFPIPSLSIGISSYAPDQDGDFTAALPDAASLMRAADVAMYRAKQRGRNQIVCSCSEEELAE